MSSTQGQPEVQVRRDRGSDSHGYAKLIVAAVIAVLIIVLVLQNTKEDWRFHIFLWWFSLPASVMLVVLLICGFLIGMVSSALLRRRKKRELKRRVSEM